MRYFDSNFTRLCDGEIVLVIGIAGGRVRFEPQARWLYSLRLMLLAWKVEVLWTAGDCAALAGEVKP